MSIYKIMENLIKGDAACSVDSFEKFEGQELDLYRWIYLQRTKFCQNNLREKQKILLQKIGLLDRGNLNFAFALLLRFKEREGHFQVPASHKEAGFSLGKWCQRSISPENGLHDDLYFRLSEAGFIREYRQQQDEAERKFF